MVGLVLAETAGGEGRRYGAREVRHLAAARSLATSGHDIVRPRGNFLPRHYRPYSGWPSPEPKLTPRGVASPRCTLEVLGTTLAPWRRSADPCV